MSLRNESGTREEPLLLPVSEVCRLLHRSKARVYEMIHMHELGHLRDGKSILVPREALDDWIKRKRRQSGC
ncbi:MAG: helix-turn-helix domain-containing protein [Fimbriimonadaceae bacterium]|nr:helix-turn-helix domain-containing protein [Fimbriimonadaceae bacterium]